MEIAIDFDGTCVSHDYPKIGSDIGAVPVLKELIKNGHKLILYTMRSDSGKDSGLFPDGLTSAVEWFKTNEIELYGIQKNPTQENWTDSNKCYAHLYIDDAALGCPLTWDKTISDRPFANWAEIRNILVYNGIIC